MKKRIVSIFLVLCITFTLLPFSVSAVQTETVGPMTFEIENGTAKLIQCGETDGVLEVPETVSGCPVTVIGAEAFRNSKITGIQLPNTLETVERSAFSGSSLESVVIPGSVKILSNSAFSRCNYLDKVVVSEGVEVLDNSAFAGSGSYAIIAVTLPSTLKKLGSNVFCNSSLHHLDIPDSVTEIGEKCFAGVRYLKELDLPASVQTIGESAFEGSELKRLYLDKTSVQIIPKKMAFACSELEELRLPNAILEICDYAFSACNQLKAVEIPDSVTAIGPHGFSGCGSIETLVLTGNLEKLGDSCFMDCHSLKTVILPPKLTSIPSQLFEHSYNLETVLIPDSVTSIGQFAFLFCYRLKGIRLPKNLKEIPHSCFRGCSSMEYVLMTSSVKRINENAFDECDKLSGFYYLGTEKQFNNSIRPEYIMPQSAFTHAQLYLIDAYPDWLFGLYDMPSETNWAYDGIAFCLMNGFMNGMGDGYFQPGSVTTRAQLVTILWRMCGEPEASVEAPFTDCSIAWAEDAIAWAAENGIVNGIGKSLFDPNGAITREQLVTVFYRFCKEYLQMDVSATQSISKFPDAAKVSSWAKDGMQWGTAVGLISGVGTKTGTELQPKGSATRAQIARVIMNFCTNVVPQD